MDLRCLWETVSTVVTRRGFHEGRITDDRKKDE
jgi:hypothetical protein